MAEAVQIVQSHLLKREPPSYGDTHVNLVEYGIARLCVVKEVHKGQIVEPLAFLSIMKWLQGLDALDTRSMEANMRSRLANQPARGDTYEDIGNLYLLRALRHFPFTSVFTFHPRCTPSWAGEISHITARLDNVNVNVDVLGDAPVNPSLGAVEFASDIDGIISWFEKDLASALLIPCDQFGPDVMMRCRSSPPNEPEPVPVRDVLLIGQYKSYTSESLNAETTAQALTSLHPNHWFKQVPSQRQKVQKLIEAMKKYHVLLFIGGYPLIPDLNSRAESVQNVIQRLGPNAALATFNVDTFRGIFKSEGEARNILVPMDAALNRKRKARDISK